MTYLDLLREGYTEGDRKYAGGYVPRNTDIMTLQAHQGKIGNRKGQWYVDLPCFHSTRYCIRQYFKKISK